MNPQILDYIAIAVMFFVALGFIVTTMVLTHVLGPKRKSKTKLEAFECGIESKGNARMPVNIKYFVVAILFVLFDVEVVFMYPWAVNFHEFQWAGFIQMIVFISILLVGFVYILKKGALEWED